MPDTTSPAEQLGIGRANTVRLIGGTPALEEALAPLPELVTVTTLGSVPADVGLVVVEDDADLRERLFTELDGLRSAAHVWILTKTGEGPTEDAIRHEADHVAWNAHTTVTIDGGWLAVALQQN